MSNCIYVDVVDKLNNLSYLKQEINNLIILYQSLLLGISTNDNQYSNEQILNAQKDKILLKLAQFNYLSNGLNLSKSLNNINNNNDFNNFNCYFNFNNLLHGSNNNNNYIMKKYESKYFN